ncbi:uncharacterized protein LOC132300962 [Cornus florida]|uniref:uncharacterized protein LOC132300962 n=1 Tax=Cornus florida TaxID=4283 RepID=UPI0028A0E924|nr:uncharacterized protein LOC132300962 [Cornus florida]
MATNKKTLIPLLLVSLALMVVMASAIPARAAKFITESNDSYMECFDGCKFNMKHTYNALLPPALLCRWNHIIWFPNHIPRHAFITWLVVHCRLYTKDRTFWPPSDTANLCSLCLNEVKTHEHLFFRCGFSSCIWDNVQHKCGVYCGDRNFICMGQWIRTIWNVECKSIEAILIKLCFSATIYFIWKERNNRPCSEIHKSLQAVWKMIEECVRARLLSIKMKDPTSLRGIATEWGLPSLINTAEVTVG